REQALRHRPLLTPRVLPTRRGTGRITWSPVEHGDPRPGALPSPRRPARRDRGCRAGPARPPAPPPCRGAPPRTARVSASRSGRQRPGPCTSGRCGRPAPTRERTTRSSPHGGRRPALDFADRRPDTRERRDARLRECRDVRPGRAAFGREQDERRDIRGTQGHKPPSDAGGVPGGSCRWRAARVRTSPSAKIRSTSTTTVRRSVSFTAAGPILIGSLSRRTTTRVTQPDVLDEDDLRLASLASGSGGALGPDRLGEGATKT